MRRSCLIFTLICSHCVTKAQVGHDADGDGFIGEDQGGLDCDDNDATVHPDAPEICDDWIDNDCDGHAGDCGLTGAIDLSTPDGMMQGSDDDDLAGWSVSGAGDVNGDGLDDLLIGAPGATDLKGAAYLVHGPATGLRDLESATTFVGSETSDAAGHAVAPAGDLNGDGLADFLVGAWGVDEAGQDAGAAYIITGPATALNGPMKLTDAASGTLLGEKPFDVAGWSLGTVADTDGNGLPELLVSAPYEDAAGAEAGVVYLLEGVISGRQSLSEARTRLVGEDSEHYAGISAADAGDTNGDGLSDVIVGAYWAGGQGEHAGAAYLMTGPMGGTQHLANADVELVGEEAGDLAGWSVASAGDTNGDGYDDVLVGAYGRSRSPANENDTAVTTQAGAAYLILGPLDEQGAQTRSLGSADARIHGRVKSDRVGFHVAAAGHLDADRYADIIIGGIGATGNQSGSGAAFVFAGPLTGSLTTSDATAQLNGVQSSDMAGWALATAGDTNGDGYDDVLVGAPYADSNGSNAGAVYLVNGHGL